MHQVFREISKDELWNSFFPKMKIENLERKVLNSKPKTAILIGAGFTNKYIPEKWGYDNIWEIAISNSHRQDIELYSFMKRILQEV
ncbi:MAG: hypothetical protein R2883_00805 [Caldisericia bacterium]